MSEIHGPVHSSEVRTEIGEPPVDPALLAQFLSKSNAECPTCGYMLKGCTTTKCPECGEHLRLSLRGDSTRLILVALRYIVWALLINACVLAIWSLGMGIYYGTRGGGTPGFAISMPIGFLVRLFVSSAAELGIGIICVIFLRRLQGAKSRHAYRGIEILALWIAILLLGNLLLSMFAGLF